MTDKKRVIYIPLKKGDPFDFDTYRGQDNLKQRLSLRIHAMSRGEGLRALFSASAGQGKTALARTLAYEMFKRKLIDQYVEVIATKFEVKADIDVFLRKIPPYTLIFIDEIHGLGSGARDALYPAIQDNIYNFNDSNKTSPLPPGLSWVGATTDLGRVHKALQRRLIPMTLDPLSKQDLTDIAMSLSFPVTREAAEEMSTRCWTPWEIKDEMHVAAGDLAKMAGKHIIDKKHVIDAANLLGIDKNGLRPKEREVLTCLFKNPRALKREVIYCLSKGALVSMSGIDDGTYVSYIEPKLLKLGYITTRSLGRLLTTKALEEYFSDEYDSTFSKANITEDTPPTTTG